MDDIKVSHIDPWVVPEVLRIFQRKYLKYAPHSATQGNLHGYLRKIDYREEGKLYITVIDYIKNMI